MQKRYHSKKERSQQQHSECIICQFKKVGIKNLVQVSSKMLIKRYYQPLYKTNKLITINKIITSRVFSNTKVAYRQAIKISKQSQMLSKFYNFQTIVSRIKSIILERVIKDRYNSIHFHGKAFQMTMRRELATKRLEINRSKQSKIDKNSGSGASTDSDQYSKKDKLTEFQRYQQHFNRQSETTSLRRLTRNLSNMVKKFDDNLEFHPSLIFEIGEYAQGHVIDTTKIDKQDFFKNQLEQNISFILSKKDNERLKTVADNSCLQFDQNYGLKMPSKIQESRKLMRIDEKTYSKISNTNKMSRMQLKQNISPNIRAHTDYDCQKLKRHKKNTISNKKSKQKFGGNVFGSLSKNKEKSKGLRNSKSRVKNY